MLASSHSTKCPFIHILPLPKLMSKPDHLLSHSILIDSVVSCSVVVQHNLVERLLGFTAKGAMVVSGMQWFAAAPTEG